MYCSKCGYQIKKGNNKCLNCGELVDSAEFCGGFWGLVGKEISVEPVEALAVQKDVIRDTEVFGECNKTKNIISDEKEKKIKTRVKKKKRFPVALLLCIALVCIIVGMAVGLLRKQKEFKKLEAKYVLLEESYVAAESGNSELSSKINELEKEIESIVNGEKELEETESDEEQFGENSSEEDYSEEDGNEIY